MRRSPVLRLDRAVARTAFALNHGACGPAVADANATLELRRSGDDDVLVTLTPLDVDADGRLVFAWNDTVHCLTPGLYEARLVSQCVPCGELLVQVGESCTIASALNVEYCPSCEGPDDSCAMSTVCTPADAACGCAPPPVIYVPPYDVPRGC